MPRSLFHAAKDSATVGALLRLYEVADGSWPNPAAVPRWVPQEVLDALVASGDVLLHDGDRYTVPAADHNRLRQREYRSLGGQKRAAQAAREGGRFMPTSSHQRQLADSPAGTSSSWPDHQQQLADSPAAAGDSTSWSTSWHQQQHQLSPADVDVDVDVDDEIQALPTRIGSHSARQRSNGRAQP